MSGNRKGFTLLELMVAIAVSGLVVALAFGAWIAVTHHTERLDRSRMLDVEARRLAVSMANELRRTPAVVRLEPQAVGYVSKISFDTVVYSTDGAGLLRNNEPVQIRSTQSRVCELTVEDLSRNGMAVYGNHLIRITLCLEDGFGNRSRICVQAAAKMDAEPKSIF
jgi:prepilin-type N-terminal cleavage/methylation domain-containing protein